MRELKNPYHAGNSVGRHHAFVGRQEIIQRVTGHVREQSSRGIALYGQRRIGKTSILERLLVDLRQYNCRTVFFDLENKARSPIFRILHTLAREIIHALDLDFELPSPTPDFATKFPNEILDQLLASLGPEERLVIFIDEFDVVAAETNTPPTQHGSLIRDLRSLLDREKLFLVFAIGRSIEDLTSESLKLFKGISQMRVSLLTQNDVEVLFSLSEENGSLLWADDARSYIYELTRGHPYLTQQLCSVLWRNHALNPVDGRRPTITREKVEASLDEVIQASSHMFEWLWQGLTPACRVVAAAMAQHPSPTVTRSEWEAILHRSGVKIIIRNLTLAPTLLKDWDLIEELTDTDPSYRFRVNLLRQWISTNKPLQYIKLDSLDNLAPKAERSYQEALRWFEQRTDDKDHKKIANRLLKEVLRENPNHVSGLELLAEIHWLEQRFKDAQEVLTDLYRLQPDLARPKLQLLILQRVRIEIRDEDKLKLLNTLINEVEVHDDAIFEQRAQLCKQLGDEAYAAGHRTSARSYYLQGQMQDRARAVLLEELQILRERGKAEDALQLAKASQHLFTAKKHGELLKQFKEETRLHSLYNSGVGAVKQGDNASAIQSLVRVVNIKPGYLDTERYLFLATHGWDPKKVKNRNIISFGLGVGFILGLALYLAMIPSQSPTLNDCVRWLHSGLAKAENPNEESTTSSTPARDLEESHNDSETSDNTEPSPQETLGSTDPLDVTSEVATTRPVTLKPARRPVFDLLELRTFVTTTISKKCKVHTFEGRDFDINYKVSEKTAILALASSHERSDFDKCAERALGKYKLSRRYSTTEGSWSARITQH